jgi:hypothetical protein
MAARAGSSDHPEFVEVTDVPDAPDRRPSNSKSMRAFIAASRASSKSVKAQHSTEAEAERFYRALLQWKRRHPDRPIAGKRVGTDVYVWIPKSGSFGPFPVPPEFR